MCVIELSEYERTKKKRIGERKKREGRVWKTRREGEENVRKEGKKKRGNGER